MKSIIHPLKDLFEQLGLASGHAEITQFIAQHAPLADSIVLAEVDFFTKDQRDFLRDELLKDAEWAAAIDLLNSQIRIPPPKNLKA
ncbi:Protein of unknown function [Polynucleobacter meluiroseus]|uniref:DUF2789 domain-containing protein n=1 Tax=Polynucleobacter meluiroseus TaxID=1938814 RepID=A0A240E2R2_9BURK|nr:DUF2789 family protein [Polynucleobacter meluiroseus]SNX29160.1 Protein of unknown function [Polynucleobacter meluiroseus]